MNRLLSKKYSRLDSLLGEEFEVRLDSRGLYVSDEFGYLWSDYGRYDDLDSALDGLADYLEQYRQKFSALPEVKISFLDFIKTHELEVVPKGMPKAEVERVLGLPTDFMIAGDSNYSNYLDSTVWKYGELEVYFTDKDVVHYCSFKNLADFSYHDAVRKIEFDMPFEFGLEPDVFKLQSILEENGVSCAIEVTADREEGCARVLCDNGVYIIFYEKVAGNLDSAEIDSINHGASLIEWERI